MVGCLPGSGDVMKECHVAGRSSLPFRTAAPPGCPADSVAPATAFEEPEQPRPHRLEPLLRLGLDLQRALRDLAQDVVDHFAEGFGLFLLQKQRALGAPLDWRARVQSLDGRRFAVRQLDANGAVVSVDLDHRRPSVLRRMRTPSRGRLYTVTRQQCSAKSNYRDSTSTASRSCDRISQGGASRTSRPR